MNIFDVIIVQPILNILLAIYALVPGGDFGISVIIFTILFRFILWPLAKKQLHQAKAMRKMQPELAKLKKKNKDNPQAQGVAMMELYKKHNISPFGSIGILLIQLPILIAIYRVVQIFATQREEIGRYTYSFMKNLPVVNDLIADPSYFNQNFLGFIDLTRNAISGEGIVWGLVVLALVAAAMQFLLSKQMSPNAASDKRLRDVLAEAGQGKEADQAEVNAIVMSKMMKVMPIMLFFIMVSLPGALALYMATTNIVAYFQNASIMKKDEENTPSPTTDKSPVSASKRAKNASEAKITRITAKDK